MTLSFSCIQLVFDKDMVEDNSVWCMVSERNEFIWIIWGLCRIVASHCWYKSICATMNHNNCIGNDNNFTCPHYNFPCMFYGVSCICYVYYFMYVGLCIHILGAQILNWMHFVSFLLAFSKKKKPSNIWVWMHFMVISFILHNLFFCFKFSYLLPFIFWVWSSDAI